MRTVMEFGNKENFCSQPDLPKNIGRCELCFWGLGRK